MIVVDTNIIAYLYLEGQFTQSVEKLLKYDSDWVVPLLWRSEFRNILALYLRKEIISYQDSLKIMESAEKFLERNEYAIQSKDVLKLLMTSTCSAYDCEFVALAKSLSIFLVTEDKKILKEFPEHSRSIKNLIYEKPQI